MTEGSRRYSRVEPLINPPTHIGHLRLVDEKAHLEKHPSNPAGVRTARDAEHAVLLKVDG